LIPGFRLQENNVEMDKRVDNKRPGVVIDKL
jgi:hypothetical protein